MDGLMSETKRIYYDDALYNLFNDVVNHSLRVHKFPDGHLVLVDDSTDKILIDSGIQTLALRQTERMS